MNLRLDACYSEVVYDGSGEREIMLFIGKPKGRSMMISNATQANSLKGLVALEIIIDLSFGFAINNIISLSPLPSYTTSE